MSIRTDQRTVKEMIRLFCKAKHGSAVLCQECAELLDYAESRLEHCPFGDKKPVCKICEVHCYSPEMRRRISEVMRFAGPRMALRHPLSSLRHLLRTFRWN